MTEHHHQLGPIFLSNDPSQSRKVTSSMTQREPFFTLEQSGKSKTGPYPVQEWEEYDFQFILHILIIDVEVVPNILTRKVSIDLENNKTKASILLKKRIFHVNAETPLNPKP